MTDKLRNLLAGGVVVVLGGVLAIFYTPQQGVARADLADAGIIQDFTPRRLACMVRGPLSDGGVGYSEKRPIVAVAKTLDGNGRRAVIWPRKAVAQVRDALADESANCRVIDTLTWAEVANFEADIDEGAGSCACVRADAGNCRHADGGQNITRNEMQPGDFVGSDCVPKVCGEIFGHPNLPAGCVQ